MIKIGLLGAAWITPMAILEPAQSMDGVKVQAVAARDPIRAAEYAHLHNIPYVENSYEDLLARNDIDIVYIALPVSFHEQWAAKALRAGKHVLCEKPLVMHSGQAKNLAKIARETGKHLIEAFHYLHHPYFNRILEIAHSHELGIIKQISGYLKVPVSSRPDQIRHNKALGGGALMDLGCYPIHMIRTIVGQEPKIISAKAEIGPTGVDLGIIAQMEFPNGIIGEIACEMPEKGELEGNLVIEGSLGSLIAEKPILPHLGGTLSVKVGDEKRIETTDEKTTFTYQLQAVLKVLQGQESPKPKSDDSIGNAVTMDAIKEIAGL